MIKKRIEDKKRINLIIYYCEDCKTIWEEDVTDETVEEIKNYICLYCGKKMNVKLDWGKDCLAG